LQLIKPTPSHTMTDIFPLTAGAGQPSSHSTQAFSEGEAALRDVAQSLEASFLAEMLKHAGFGQARTEFGGGAEEDQFASLLRQEHAQALAARGGIGLAENLFEALLARQGGTAPDSEQ